MARLRRTTRLLGFFGWFFAIPGLLFSPSRATADWLADLETYATGLMATAAIPGMAMAIVQNGSVIYAKGFGHVSQDASSTAVTADTVFDIGSCSKAFTAMQLAILKDAGSIAWTDRAGDRLSGFRMSDPWVDSSFQIEDLLDHRSGLPAYALMGMMPLGYAPSRILDAVRYEQPVTSFRSTFAYQNAMYLAASLLIAERTGKTWSQHLSQSIFQPLGMTRSVTTQAEKNGLGNVALGHGIVNGGSLWTIPADWPGFYFTDNILGAGAVRSSANDMARWMRLVLGLGASGGQTLVKEETVRYLLAPKILLSEWNHGADSEYYGPVSYGGGWMYFGLTPYAFLTHDGTTLGFKASVGLIPDQNVGIVVLTNIGSNLTSDPAQGARSQAAQKITFRFYDLFLNRNATADQLEGYLKKVNAVLAPAAQTPTAAAAAGKTAASLSDYCGVYVNPGYGAFAVGLAGDHLEITMAPLGMKAPMTQSGDQFLAKLPDYPADYPMTIPFTFAFPATGPATMTMGSVMGWPQYETFTRLAATAPLVPLLLGGE